MDFRCVGLIRFAIFLAAAALFNRATAETTYTVLGTEGWIIPNNDGVIPNNDGVYRTWAADNKEFKVGDVLVFNFSTGAHDVTEVTKANYDSCGKTNFITTVATGPANIKLTTAGMHYYICSFGQHCIAGQKLAVKVTTTTFSPPSSNSASSTTTFGGFSVAILSIVLVFVF